MKDYTFTFQVGSTLPEEVVLAAVKDLLSKTSTDSEAIFWLTSFERNSLKMTKGE